MKPLARRAVASFACAALLMAQWPASAWAGAGAPPQAIDEAAAMKMFTDLGMFKDANDPARTYFSDGKSLTPIGRAMFLSLKGRYNPAEEVEAVKPMIERLRTLGPYSQARQEGAARALRNFQEKFGSLADAQSGSVEEAFRTGAMREALMTGAAIPDPPKGSAYAQVEVEGGFEFWDKDGLAFRMNKNKVTTYNRELQKTQKAMNANRPPQVEFIPETGRYSYQMLQYSYWRLRNQEIAYAEAAKTDRMIAFAELLGVQIPNDLWFKRPGLEDDLVRRAKAKTYNHHGTVYSVFDIVDSKFVQRRAYLEGARNAVQRFETDMNQFKATNMITDSQVATMSLNEQNALRWLSLTVLETQMFHVRNQRERVDPTSPDAVAIMKMVDESDLNRDQRIAYKEQGQKMKGRLDELAQILNRTREALNKADYAGSLDTVQAALASTQKELGDLSVDYSLYLEAPSMAWLAKQQAHHNDGGYNPIKHLYNGVSYLVRGGYGLVSSDYRENMRAIEGDSKSASMQKQYTDIAALIAGGSRENWTAARNRVMAMNPGAVAYSGSASTTEDMAKLTDALKISSSLRRSHERIEAVAETNKTLDAVATFVTWTVSIALLAPVARASLNLVGKMSNAGIKMMTAGETMTGVSGLAARVTGRMVYAVGEIAKHSAARLESLEPDPGRIAEVAGNSWVKQYLAASAARAGSVAIRQATFTGMSAGISGAFTLGSHLIDTATANGVNIGGWQIKDPSYSMFTPDFDGAGKAFWTGAKGGAWWANESFHPALGYIGLPSTVFSGTRLAGAMETIGSKGVVGSLSTGIRSATNSTAALEAAAARGEMGFLERLSQGSWYAGKPAAFTLSMADNVAKYAVFSQVAGYVGQKWSWYVDTNVPIAVPFVGVVNNPEEDVERRIKRANQTGHAWLESPAWLLIPTHAAHGARDAGPFMQVREGMKQYDQITPEFPNGRTAEYANAPVDAKLPLKAVKPPLSQRLFEARLWGAKPATEWIVTKQAKEAGQLKEITRLAKEGGDINPIELMGVRDLIPGKSDFRSLKVTDEVQEMAYMAAIDGLVGQPVKSLEALTVKPGSTVKGWGRVSPKMQIELAKALYVAEGEMGRKLPKELSARVNEILKMHIEANPGGKFFAALRENIVKTPLNSPNLDAAQRELVELAIAEEARIEKGDTSYVEVVGRMREMTEARLKAGKLSAKEAETLTSFFDAFNSTHDRFNSFNKVEVVRKQTDVVIDAQLMEFGNTKAMSEQLNRYRREVGKWAEGRDGEAAAGPFVKPEVNLDSVLKRLGKELSADAAAGKFTVAQQKALSETLASIGEAPWVVRDAKGGPIPGWRAKQFVRLMQMYLGEGSHARHVESASEDLFAAMRSAYKESPKLIQVVDAIEGHTKSWVAESAKSKAELTPMGPLMEKVDATIAKAEGLTPGEAAALADLSQALGRLEREGSSKGIMTMARQGGNVEEFVKAPTSVGKTLIAYEGLLPYLEAEAAGSGRKVMFLTFNTKLQAQAKFDFIAFNRLGSKVKFETYEGLKTMIAEGKTKGRSVAEEYLMMQDEMDAAGQQPALTIGMVTGRVSRLNAQTKEMNNLAEGLIKSINRLNSVRVESAEVQISRVKSLADAISAEHVPAETLGKIRGAADDALAAVRDLKRASTPEEVRLAEQKLGDAADSLRRFASGLPASEGEAATTMLAALGRMKEALDSRPTSNPEVRARLAAEMKEAFRNQSRLMLLTETTEGFSRLPAEAKRARLALEAKLERLGKDLSEAQNSGSEAGRRRASLIEEQIELAKSEKALVERFDGVDASARLFAIDEQIAAIRAGQARGERTTVNPKLERLMRESIELDAAGTPEAAAKKAGVEARLKNLLEDLGRKGGSNEPGVVEAYRAETANVMRVEKSLAEAEVKLERAKARQEPTADIEAQISSLGGERAAARAKMREAEFNLGAAKNSPKLDGLVAEAQRLESRMDAGRKAVHQEYRATLDKVHSLSARMGEADAAAKPGIEAERASARGRLREIELETFAKPEAGDLGAMTRRLEMLEAKADNLQRLLDKGGDAGVRRDLSSQLAQTGKELKALRGDMRAEVMRRFNAAGDEIVALAQKGERGWDAKAERLLEARRVLQEAYAGDESALYTVYRQMKESVRELAENPRLLEEPYMVPGGEGLEPGAVLKRAEFLVERAAKIETKTKDGGMGPLEAQLMLAREKIKTMQDKGGTPEFFDAAVGLGKLERQLLAEDAFAAAKDVVKAIDGPGFVGALPGTVKLLIETVTGRAPSGTAESLGLTRLQSSKMLQALFKDPLMPPHQRDALMWSYLHSMLFPKGLSGRGGSYVRNELINMVQGFHDNPAGVRGNSKFFNVVHNGQWFESMDNASRRWWELEYGTDLTLPYTHNSMSTIKDVTTNKKTYFVSLSGTSGAKFEAHLRANKISIVGEGSAMPKNVQLEILSTPEARLNRVTGTLEKLRNQTLDHVVLKATDVPPEAARAEFEAFVKAKGLKLSNPQVVKISEMPEGAARAWLQSIRATQKNTGLIVLSVSDTRALRAVESRLKKAGVKQDEIAKVFADTEYLRQNVPEADVIGQMNIEGLNSGKVKVLILDTRVGGRGLDLNFKGERNSADPNAFRGYSNFEMLVIGPEEMSQVHMIQAMGRIDTGRTLGRAPRQFSLLLDVETAKIESVFKEMFERDPFFVEIRKDPAYQDFVRAKGLGIDWNSANEYLVFRSNDGSGEGQLLAQRGDRAVRENLARRNLEVEENLLRQSNVLTDAPTTPGKHPALERIR